MGVTLDINAHGRALTALKPAKVKRALVRTVRKAGSTALRDMRSETSKRVRKRKRLKVRAVRSAIRIKRPKGTDLEALVFVLDISDQHQRVADYPHRQTKKGVSAAINKGSRSLLAGAFIRTVGSGHRGVFRRRGADRLPIDEQLASRVIDAVSHPGEIEGIQLRGQTSMRATMDRVFPMELDKLR